MMFYITIVIYPIACNICSGNTVLSPCQKVIFPKYRFIPTIDKRSGFRLKIPLIYNKE